MKSIKVIHLISSLSKSEKHKIHHFFRNNQQAKKVLALFEIIIGAKEENLTKEYIFLKLYNEPYTKDKDYLLRNAYRNLAKKVEDFLIDQAFHSEIQKNLNLHNLYLLKSFQQLRLYHLFDVNYSNVVNKSLADNDYLTASSVTSLQVTNYLHHLTPQTKNYQKADGLINAQLAYLSSFYLNNLNKSYVDKEYINKTLGVVAAEKVDEPIPIYDDGHVVVYEAYLKLKYDYFSGNFSDVEAHLKECIHLLNKLQLTDEIKQEFIFCRLALAHEYSLQEKYEQANIIYEDVTATEHSLDEKLKTTLIFDYISNLIRLEHYDIALKKIVHFERHFDDQTPALILKIRFLKLMLFAFKKDSELLRGHIPTCNGLLDYEKYFCRLLYSMEAYINGDYNNAYRECINFKNSLRYKAPKFDVRDILNFYLRFYSMHKKNKDTGKQLLVGLKKLQKDMHTYSENALPEFKEYLPFIWLKKEADTTLKAL